MERLTVFIPERQNLTNGDVITALFPDFKAVSDIGDTILIGQDEPYCKCQFNRNWWNAPYKGAEIMDEISNTKEVLKRLAKNHDTAAVIAGRNRQRSIDDVKQYIATELNEAYLKGYRAGIDEGYNQCELEYMTKLQDQEEHMHTARVNVLRNCLEDIIKTLDSSPSELARVLDELMQAEVKPL